MKKIPMKAPMKSKKAEKNELLKKNEIDEKKKKKKKNKQDMMEHRIPNRVPHFYWFGERAAQQYPKRRLAQTYSNGRVPPSRRRFCIKSAATPPEKSMAHRSHKPWPLI